MAALYFKSIDPTPNRFRWYTLDLQPDLFGGVNLVCRWGRIGQRGGSVRSEHFADEGAANAALERALERRKTRGYERERL